MNKNNILTERELEYLKQKCVTFDETENCYICDKDVDMLYDIEDGKQTLFIDGIL